MSPVAVGEACALGLKTRVDRSRWRPCTRHLKRPKCHDTSYYRGKASCGLFCQAAQSARRHWLASLPYWPSTC